MSVRGYVSGQALVAINAALDEGEGTCWHVHCFF